MRELIDKLFPEPGEPDILGGMTDFTHGRATKYFVGLNPEDRAIVQWYLQQSIMPPHVEFYAVGLANSYAIVDPERKSADAIHSAHEELQRTERYLGIFLRSKDFFPKVERFDVLVRDESGKPNHLEEEGWGSFASPIGIFNLGWQKDQIRKRTLPLFSHIHAFLDDPKGAPLHFDQEEILKRFQQQKNQSA